MKLRNKRTGEIADVEISINCMLVTHQDGRIEQYYFDSIKDLLEWEDYEEPEIGFIIDPMEEDYISADDDSGYDESDIERAKELGIWFESEEEAEKAVEKLKAYKRLKDKGFRLNHWKEAQLRPNMSCVAITGNIKVDEETKSDLDLLFGEEEE